MPFCILKECVAACTASARMTEWLSSAVSTEREASLTQLALQSHESGRQMSNKITDLRPNKNHNTYLQHYVIRVLYFSLPLLHLPVKSRKVHLPSISTSAAWFLLGHTSREAGGKRELNTKSSPFLTVSLLYFTQQFLQQN